MGDFSCFLVQEIENLLAESKRDLSQKPYLITEDDSLMQMKAHIASVSSLLSETLRALEKNRTLNPYKFQQKPQNLLTLPYGGVQNTQDQKGSSETKTYREIQHVSIQRRNSDIKRTSPYQIPVECTNNDSANMVHPQLPASRSTPVSESEADHAAFAIAFADGVIRSSPVKRQIPKHFICDSCGSVFHTPFSMKRHKKAHTGDKPYRCMWVGVNEAGCGKSFAEKAGLKRHLRSHTGEKPFICNFPECGKRYADNVNLGRHYERYHKLP